MPLAALIIPLLPGLIKTIVDLISAVRDDSATDEETKAQLDAHQRILEQLVVAVGQYTPKAF